MLTCAKSVITGAFSPHFRRGWKDLVLHAICEKGNRNLCLKSYELALRSSRRPSFPVLSLLCPFTIPPSLSPSLTHSPSLFLIPRLAHRSAVTPLISAAQPAWRMPASRRRTDALCLRGHFLRRCAVGHCQRGPGRAAPARGGVEYAVPEALRSERSETAGQAHGAAATQYLRPVPAMPAAACVVFFC